MDPLGALQLPPNPLLKTVSPKNSGYVTGITYARTLVFDMWLYIAIVHVPLFGPIYVEVLLEGVLPKTVKRCENLWQTLFVIVFSN